MLIALLDIMIIIALVISMAVIFIEAAMDITAVMAIMAVILIIAIMTVVATMDLMTRMNVMALSSLSFIISDILVRMAVMNMVTIVAAIATTASSNDHIGCYGAGMTSIAVTATISLEALVSALPLLTPMAVIAVLVKGSVRAPKWY